MPQGEAWWNPYRMVPVRPQAPTRTPPQTHERFSGLSGRLSCRLENLTPLLVGRDGQPRRFIERDRRPVIPGTSLKGAIRSLAEIVGNGCAVLGKVDEAHAPCSPDQGLCITCRLFGALRGGKVHAGQVSFGDGRLDPDVRPPVLPTYQVVLGSPKPKHTAFYRTNSLRKAYFHQPRRVAEPLQAPSKVPATQISTLEPLPAGFVFGFEVDFFNLTEPELGLLVYAIGLEDHVEVDLADGTRLVGPLRHKIGMGKPLGMGSVAIAIERATLIDRAARYRGLGGTTTLEAEELATWVARLTAPHRDDRSETMQALRKMLVWDPSDDRSFRYPTNAWFKDHSQVPLKPI